MKKMTQLLKVEILEIVDVEKVENRCFFAKKPNQELQYFLQCF